MKTNTKMVGATCIALTLTLGTLSAQTLVDPGFELGAGWNLFNGAAYQFNPSFARTGNGSMADITMNNVPGSFEQFNAAPGDLWSLSGYGMTPQPLLGGTAFGILQLTFFDSANNNLGTVETSPGNAATSAQINGSSPAGVWIPLTVSAHAPANTAYGQVFTLVVDFGSPSPEGAYFDDLSLVATAAPEPSSLALLALASLGGFAAWRRRK